MSKMTPNLIDDFVDTANRACESYPDTDKYIVLCNDMKFRYGQKSYYEESSHNMFNRELVCLILADGTRLMTEDWAL